MEVYTKQNKTIVTGLMTALIGKRELADIISFMEMAII